MKILLVTTEFPPGPGGIGVHAFALAHGFHQLGHSVTVFASQDFASHSEVLEFNSSLAFSISTLRRSKNSFSTVVRAEIQLIKAIRAQAPDVLIASGARSLWLALLAGSITRFPWVAVGHGTEFATASPWRRLLTRRACERASLVVCVSQYTLERLLAIGTRPRRTEVIPNGADPRSFHPRKSEAIITFRKQLGASSGRLLLTVGNVTDRKGQDVVIRALPKIIEQVGNVDYAIVGLPTCQDRLMEIARRLGVDERVHFLGRIDRGMLVDAYNSCDIFVMTSRHSAGGDFEGYGIAVIEAALCGKAAVVTGDSGLEEAVIHRETGLVVQENDPGATAEAVIELLSNKTLLRRLGDQARARALETLTWDAMLNSYVTAVESIVFHPAKNQLMQP